MNKTSALNHLQTFLESNPSLKPTDGFTLSEPSEQRVDNQTVYFFWWIESSGQNARGGYSYYVMPDGTVILPSGGSGQPETLESVYSRWRSQK
ncbi:MAG: hypothetical protein WAW60_02905 [Candidatus Saccharimonadales bacterium]